MTQENPHRFIYRYLQTLANQEGALVKESFSSHPNPVQNQSAEAGAGASATLLDDT